MRARTRIGTHMNKKNDFLSFLNRLLGKQGRYQLVMGNISSKTMSKATISSLLISSLHLLFGPVWFIWRYLMIFVLELPVRAPVLRFAFWSYCLAAGRLAVSFLRVYVFSPSINLQDPPRSSKILQDPPRSSKPLIGRL